MSERAERARLFVALDLPASVRERIAGWARTATADLEGLRLVPAEMLHVTLAFLGWREVTQAPLLGDLVLPCAVPVRGLSAAGVAWLPPRRPRVLAVDLDDGEGELEALQRRVVDALAAGGGYEPESRPFRAHVTAGRVGKRVRLRARELAGPELEPFAGCALTLYRSRLAPSGARYEPLARAELQGDRPAR